MFKYNKISKIKNHIADDKTLLFQTMLIHDDAGDVYKAEITEDLFRIYTTLNGQHIDFTHDLLLAILTQVEQTQLKIK